MRNPPHIGVVIVTFQSADVIVECLECLASSDYQHLKVVIVDNCSTDDTIRCIQNYCAGKPGYAELSVREALAGTGRRRPDVALIKAPINQGYAGGVNIGLKYLMAQEETDLFWMLNPDVQVGVDTASQFSSRAQEAGSFGLMGGRIIYVSPEDTVQADGGVFSSWTGTCKSINSGKSASATPLPGEDELDYISGASLVASRAFIDRIGLMPEDYFLFYEEVDWAHRRGEMKLVIAPQAMVKHHGGTSIGSGIIGRKQGTAFSNYFNFRNRLRFMWKYWPWRVPVAYIYSILKVIQLIVNGHIKEAGGAARGLFNMTPPKKVRLRLSADAAKIAFGD